ncbi:transcriptional regulator [Secundilactobacillus pentosiphilus]|uniref:Transcriptional regulator n=2 Tax=Secundilactobacillus pentosiphilus TaxID=1714682 RepID=A0A1Z5IL87_9LACO|nr:transcriptional regulator [Secundilactobacillus pentosiphilus]
MATMKDIAREASVSVATVSMVLNNKPNSRISKHKREEIERLARKLNYQPNFAAISLSKQQSLNIALIVPDITNPFFSLLTKEIDLSLEKDGYSTIFVDSNNSFQNEKKAIESMVSRGVDGIILVPSNEFFRVDQAQRKQLIANLDKPFILLNAYPNDLDVSYVNFDNVNGAYIATQELIDKGHREIAFIQGQTGFVNAAERLAGYQQALRDHHLAIKPQNLFMGDYSVQSGYELASTITQRKDITAILSSNDLMLFGMIKWAKMHHIDVLHQYAMIGFDNDPYSEILEVPLTSVDQRPKAMIEEALAILLERIGNDHPVNKHALIKPELIKRASVFAPVPTSE